MRLLGASAYCDSGAGIARAQSGRIAFGESVHQLLMEVIMTGGDRWRYPLVIHLPRTIDVFAQAIIDVALAAAFLNLRFVVELDLRNEQASEAPRVVVQTAFFFTDFDRQIGLGNSIAPGATQRRRILRSKGGR